MAEGLITIGDPRGLQFQISWSEKRTYRSAEAVTYGKLALWVRDNLIWGKLGKNGEEVLVEWSWIELLEFLSNAWPYLEFESGYPLSLRPIWPAKLRGEAEERWQTVPEEIGREEEEELFAFEETHNLARGVHGLFAPSVWLVREGGLMTIGTDRMTVHRPLQETLDTLRSFCEVIAERIANRTDERAKAALRGWRDRLSMGGWELARIATQWPEEQLRLAAGTEDLWGAFEIEGDEFQITETLEVAGQTRGFLGAEQLHSVFELLKSIGRRPTPELDNLSIEAGVHLGIKEDDRPWSQGHRLANWFRARPGVEGPEGRVDVDAILKAFGVHVADVDLINNLLDAVACWGPRHGPAVWVNQNDKHKRVDGARRSTLAHELCHLLVDRDGALPLADVINGNAPRWVEQRADAFTAELLLPRSLAVADLAPDTNIEAHVDRLTAQYGVSHELTAWQIRNSGIPLSPANYAKLRSMVSDPKRF